MLSRVFISKSHLLQQALKPCATLSQRSLSLSTPQENKSAWYQKAWPAWQMYKNRAGESAGPTFTFGLLAYLVSKEIYIIGDETLLLGIYGIAFYHLIKGVGPTVGNMLDNHRKEILDTMSKGRNDSIALIEDAIAGAKEGEAALEHRQELFDIIKANNEMRLELEYRTRLQEVESEVKKRLDYQIDLQNLEKQVEEDHIISWVEKQVVGSLTAKHETDAIGQCIKDLDTLAAAKV